MKSKLVFAERPFLRAVSRTVSSGYKLFPFYYFTTTLFVMSFLIFVYATSLNEIMDTTDHRSEFVDCIITLVPIEHRTDVFQRQRYVWKFIQENVLRST